MKRLHLAAVAALALVVALGISPAVPAKPAPQDPGCQLRGGAKHVIYIQFDNTHFVRDNPNVPSDLEQMPNLLNFVRSNGDLMTDHHTGLISHTASGILTSLTGLYGDRMGMPVSNSYRYFSGASSNTGVSFAYWTAPVFDPAGTATDATPTMVNEAGKVTPAPWVSYTRAGCNFGAVATANTILENTKIDIPTVFGSGSPEATEVAGDGGAAGTQSFADFVGIGVHCAKGNALCSTANSGKTDALPDEPGGYTGFNGLFGAKYTDAQISPSTSLKDLNGNVIQDSNGHAGFPGFDGMSAAVSLAYVAAMQEHGVPVTYAYISDAHDLHPTGPAFGPGSAGYVAALKSYDDAFGKFFTRLAADGINKSNTLFVFTADEGDHFVGGPPSPASCDGVTTPCTYSQIGEVNGNLAGLLATERGNTTPFKVHSDSAPAFYVDGNPSQTDPATRGLERDVSQLTAVNPITGATDHLTRHLADRTEQKLLHMVTSDPLRTPTFVMFADPNYFLFAGAPNCGSPCVTVQPGFAWNHGDDTEQIGRTWLGLVGPGVTGHGQDDTTWSDHADIRPTMMSLLGLKDDYSHDGRVLVEAMGGGAGPDVGRPQNGETSSLLPLMQAYKQLDAPFGDLARASEAISTVALASNSSGDGTYTRLEADLADITSKRDALAGQIQSLLEGIEFGNGHLDSSQARQLTDQANALIARVQVEADQL